MPFLDLDAFANTPLVSEPFPHLVLTRFIRADAFEALDQDFPPLRKPGSFPVSELRYGARFAHLLDELQSDAVQRAFEAKFAIDLADRPTMITVRAMCRERDGQIHTDSRSKLVTVLLYMNAHWHHSGGRLRLLRSASLDDAITEIVPGPGTLVAFLNSDNAWHGHARYSGQRRAIQLNWVRDARVVRREQGRHRLSARLKRINPFA